MTHFSIEYVKNKSDFLKTLENSDNLKLNNLQNYVPLYEKFFVLNDSNYNNINLNHKFSVSNISERTNFNNLQCTLSMSVNRISQAVSQNVNPLIL